MENMESSIPFCEKNIIQNINTIHKIFEDIVDRSDYESLRYYLNTGATNDNLYEYNPCLDDLDIYEEGFGVLLKRNVLKKKNVAYGLKSSDIVILNKLAYSLGLLNRMKNRN